MIAFMEWSLLAAPSLPDLEGVRPPPLILQPGTCKEKAEPVGGNGQGNLGFDAGGDRTGHLQGRPPLLSGVRSVASGQARPNILEFCLLCSVRSLLLEEDGGLTQEIEVVDYP